MDLSLLPLNRFIVGRLSPLLIVKRGETDFWAAGDGCSMRSERSATRRSEHAREMQPMGKEVDVWAKDFTPLWAPPHWAPDF